MVVLPRHWSELGFAVPRRTKVKAEHIPLGKGKSQTRPPSARSGRRKRSESPVKVTPSGRTSSKEFTTFTKKYKTAQGEVNVVKLAKGLQKTISKAQPPTPSKVNSPHHVSDSEIERYHALVDIDISRAMTRDERSELNGLLRKFDRIEAAHTAKEKKRRSVREIMDAAAKVLKSYGDEG